MQLAGKTGTEEYRKLVQKAGELADIQGDVAREIKNMASDTRVFDVLLEGTQLVAGGFSVAQGAAALFGVESEDLQQVMVKLQSAIAITTGLQQIGNAVQRESALAKAADTVASTASTIATKILGTSVAATSVQFKLLRGAIIGTGLGALVVLAGTLIANWDNLVSWFKKGTDGMSGFGKAIDKVKEMAMGVYEVVKEYIISPFQAVGKLLSGDFAGAFEEIKQGLDVVGNYSKGASEQMTKNQADAVQRMIENQKKLTSETLLSGADRMEKELEVSKAAGISADELYQKEKAILTARIAAYRIALSAISDQNSDAWKDMNKNLEDAMQKLAVTDAANTKRLADEGKARAQQAAADAKERADKEREAIREAEDAKLATVEEGVKKQQKAINQQYDRQIEDLKRKLAEEKNLTKAAREAINETIKNLDTKRKQDLDKVADDELKKSEEDGIKRQKSEIETEISITNARLAEVEKGSEAEYTLKSQLLEDKAKLDELEIKNSTDSEELKAAKILEINTNLNKNLKNLSDERIKTADERSKDEVFATTQLYEQGIISKSQYEKQLSDISIKALEDEIAERKAAGQDTVDLEQKLSEKRIAIAEKEKEYRKQLFEELSNAMGEIGNTFFDMHKQGLDQQMEDLQHYYTTDAEEAKKNKDMKLITEEEMSRRQLEIKRKQAQAEKNQAIFNIILSTAQSIAKTASTMGFPLAIPFIAIAAILGAVQLAAVSSRPLPKYWKGRKGGKGEYALLGEYGPEIAWLPFGTSIMPAHDTRRALAGDRSAFDRWNMPRIEPKYPAMPRVSQQLVNQYYQSHKNEDRLWIDYEKLGKSVAKYMRFPKQKDVSIHFDKSGLSVTEGNTTTKVLNSKYSANV
jgi:hypothetical protein